MTDLSEAVELYKNAQQNPKCGGKTDDHWYVGNPRYQIEADGDEKTSPECYFSSDPSDHEDLVWKNPEFLGTHEYMNDESTFQCPAAFHVFKSKHVKTTGDYNTCCNTYSGEYCRGGNSANEYQLSNLGTDNYHCALTAEAIEAWKKRAPTETLHLCGSAPFHPSKNLKTCPWDYKPGTSFCAPFNNQFCKDKTNHTSKVCTEFAKQFYRSEIYQDSALDVINTVCQANPNHEICRADAFDLDVKKTLQAAISVMKATNKENKFIADTEIGARLINSPLFLKEVDDLLVEDCNKPEFRTDKRCSCFFGYTTETGAQNYREENILDLAEKTGFGAHPMCILQKCQKYGLKTADVVTAANTTCPKCFSYNNVSNIGPGTELSGVKLGEGGCGTTQTNTPETPNSGSNNTGMIVGIAVGGSLVVLAIIIIAVYYRLKRNKKNTEIKE